MAIPTFDTMPAVLANMQNQMSAMQQSLNALIAKDPVNEVPIDGKELRKRLQISRPTEIAMRKRGELPYLLVCGQYRYHWQSVLKALAKK